MTFNTDTKCKFVAFIPETDEIIGSDNFKYIYQAARLNNRIEKVQVIFYKNDTVFGKFENGQFYRI